MKYIAKLVDRKGFVQEIVVPKKVFERGYYDILIYLEPLACREIDKLVVAEPLRTKRARFEAEYKTLEETTTMVFRELR